MTVSSGERARFSPTPTTDTPSAPAATPPRPAKLAILTNIVSPARVPIFQHLGERFDTLLLLSGREDNRRWEQQRVPGVRTKVAWGLTVKRTVPGGDGRTAEQRYLHLNPGYLWELLRFRPDAIVTAEMGFRSLVGVLYGRLRGVPVWVWWGSPAHSVHLRDRSLAKRALRRHFFARLVPGWISYGRAATAYLASLGVPPDRIVDAQNPVDERLYRGVIVPYPLPTELPRPRALFVGRLVEWKGIYPLLEATAALQREGLVFSLVVVGDGPDAERFDAETERLGIAHLHRVQYLSPKEMPAMYRACDVLVFPSLDEIWGLVVNEALLSGLPVIASVHAGCAEDLVPPENVFDPADRASFVDAFRRAIEGTIVPGPAAPIRPIREVAEAIAAEIAGRLAPPPGDGAAAR